MNRFGEEGLEIKKNALELIKFMGDRDEFDSELEPLLEEYEAERIITCLLEIIKDYQDILHSPIGAAVVGEKLNTDALKRDHGIELK